MMKIKESNEKITLKALPSVFFAGTLIAAVLRTVQMFKFIDHETGFYTGGTAVTAVLYIVIAAACLFFVAVSFLSSQSKNVDLLVRKNPSVAAVSVIFAISFFYDFFSAFFSSFEAMGTASVGSVFQSMMLSGTIPLFFQSIFAFFSGIYFFIFAKGVIKEDARIAKHKILALAPVGWAGARLIHRFVEQISYIRVSDLLLELVLLAVMILFFMAFAQVASGVYSKGFRWRITGFGLSAALIAFALNCARLIFTLAKGSQAINGSYPYSLSDFIFALFVIVLVTTLIKENKAEEREQA